MFDSNAFDTNAFDANAFDFGGGGGGGGSSTDLNLTQRLVGIVSRLRRRSTLLILRRR